MPKDTITFGIITERKTPPDRRVVFSPKGIQDTVQRFPNASFTIEPSNIRVFTNSDYDTVSCKVTDDLSDCDVLLGVKEVPVDALIPNKKYFFFSHTIKKQPYNQKLLQAILAKNIEFYDHETIVNDSGFRLIGFGHYAGLVGTYNALKAYGIKNKIYQLPKAVTLADQQELISELRKITLPNLKIVLTGNGKVGNGARTMLDAIGIQRVSVVDYLSKNFEVPVYVQIDVLDYTKRKDGLVKGAADFYQNPTAYDSDFMRFSAVSDIYIAGHFYGDGAPHIFTREDAKSKDFKIKLVADISCDIDGPVACTLRSSTIEDPIYGYHPQTEQEVPYTDPEAIVVMAVDNLPCELPKDASDGFGAMFLEHVIPAFFNDDADGILDRARMTLNGKLTPRFEYLQAYVDGYEEG